MKYSVITFGCRVNQADSLAIEDELRARGGTTSSPRDADVVIVNSCSVTASADQGTRQTVRRIARDNPGVRVIVTGCYATRRPDDIAALPNVLRVVPNDRKEQLAAAVAGEFPGRGGVGPSSRGEGAGAPTTAERFGDGDGSCGGTLEPGVAGRSVPRAGWRTGHRVRVTSLSHLRHGRENGGSPTVAAPSVDRGRT